MSRLRGYQAAIKHEIYGQWQAGRKVVMPVLPTGAGKTVIMADIAREYPGYGCAMAHRSELVGQISTALAKEGLRHNIIAPPATIRNIVEMHMEECGRTYYDGRANWAVASVDTILRRAANDDWFRRVGIVFQDEGHHTLKDNKWGRAFAMFPNAYGLLPTATPRRADGKGLGRHASGIVDVLIEGPTMRWLIEQGYLTGYRIFAPKVEDLDLEDIALSKDGDFNKAALSARVKASTKIVGDVVSHYLKHAAGKLGITFAVDIEHAQIIANAFNAANVPAAVISSETPDTERRAILRRFRNRELLQLVNVDLFGEGFDLPAIEVVSMARPTASYGLFAQQFGRALRLMISKILQAAWDTYTPEQRKAHIAGSGKPYAIIVDHVGNVIRHRGPPDRPRTWSLDDAERRTRAVQDGVPMRTCTNPECLEPYERALLACPTCGTAPPEPKDRSKPEFVDGDLMELTEDVINAMFGEVQRIDGPCYAPNNVTPIVAAAIHKKHNARQQAQAELRASMAQWAGLFTGDPDRVNYRRFFHAFGIDVLSAKALGATEALELKGKIDDAIRLWQFSQRKYG